MRPATFGRRKPEKVHQKFAALHDRYAYCIAASHARKHPDYNTMQARVAEVKEISPGLWLQRIEHVEARTGAAFGFDYQVRHDARSLHIVIFS